MVNNKIIGGLFTLLLLMVIGFTSVLAYSPYMMMPPRSMDAENYNMPFPDMGAQNHMMSYDMNHDINSGRDFASHVRENNYMFNAEMNPGVHHRGYSGFMFD